MPWVTTSFNPNEVLPAAKLTIISSDFAAMAFQEAGSPLIGFPNSFGTANAGLVGASVSSFRTFHAESGFSGPQVSSFGTINVASTAVLPGISAAGVSSLGVLVTQLGYDFKTITASIGWTTAEKTLLTCSLAAHGNRVLLNAAMEGIGGGNISYYSIRVGSLGGVVVSSDWSVSAVAGTFAANATVRAWTQPASGPASYVLTGRASTGTFYSKHIVFDAIELDRK